ncbi:MAG: DUF465 domain-containing protein [Caenibius sp.]
MSNIPHELADEFPQDRELLRKLKLENAHFVTLSDRYHAVNGEIHRIESEIENTSDDYAEGLKKKRLALVDEISGILAGARGG